MSNARIQFSTADESKWTSINPNLREGELVFSKTSLGKYKAVVGAPGGSNYKDSILLWDEAAAEKLTADAQSAAATATQKATEAAQQAQAATAGGETATTKAVEAVNSANSAADSASAASGYASTATAKATAAANSASAAASSESNAAASANTAVQKATAAANSAETATAKATAAADSASAANDSAIIAGQKATAAANSAGAAANSAAAAKASEDYSASVASDLQTLIVIKNTPMNHNAIFSRRNLGTIASGDIDQFVSKYVNNGNFGDIYVGDYITIQDGTYNTQWVVKHFDPRLYKGDTALETHHIGFTPMTYAGTARMNATNVTTGGYAGSEMHTTTLPALWSKLQSVLGSHLLKHRVLLSNSVNTSAASMAGAGWTGASNGWAWYDSYGELMSEVEIYGCTVFSSSFYDVGEACEKLAYYNFVNHCYDGRVHRWLRAVASGTAFARAGNDGDASNWDASYVIGVCPLILIG